MTELTSKELLALADEIQTAAGVRIITDTDRFLSDDDVSTITAALRLAAAEPQSKGFDEVIERMISIFRVEGAEDHLWFAINGVKFKSVSIESGQAAQLLKLETILKEVRDRRSLSSVGKVKADARPWAQGGQADVMRDALAITYTNYQGETSKRLIVPKSVRYGSTEWHPEPQWLLLAYDLKKQAYREFVLKDFGARID